MASPHTAAVSAVSILYVPSVMTVPFASGLLTRTTSWTEPEPPAARAACNQRADLPSYDTGRAPPAARSRHDRPIDLILFPYTTLFRSGIPRVRVSERVGDRPARRHRVRGIGRRHRQDRRRRHGRRDGLPTHRRRLGGVDPVRAVSDDRPVRQRTVDTDH